MTAQPQQLAPIAPVVSESTDAITRRACTRLRRVLPWDEREVSLLQSGSGEPWTIWTSIPKWIRALERKGWVPALVQDTHVRFDLPPNAITIRAAKSYRLRQVSQKDRPRRLSLGGDEISVSMGDGRSDDEWDVLITSSPWGNRFQRRGWRPTNETPHEIRFLVPESAITIRSRRAIENPTLRGVVLASLAMVSTSDDEH